MLVILILLRIITTYGASIPKPLNESSDVGLDTVQLIEKHGYVCETHYITTEDGYNLTYYRIPNGIDDDVVTPRPAVLLMHGLISSSADFVNMGPGRSLGYILADAGYDVWLANARGNANSRNHTSLDVVEDAEEFFNFSWHEIGYYDLANAIDYILDLNGDDDVHYVGHSQGTTVFFVLASTRPEYNDKIKVAHLLAPSAIMEHAPDNLLRALSEHIEEVEDLSKELKMYEIPFTDVIRQVGSSLCINPDLYVICDVVFALVGAGDLTEIDADLVPMILTNVPSNSAFKQLFHYGQLIKNGGFHQYDYGAEKNLEVYGTETPPAYDFAKVTAPVALYYANNDGVQNPEDVQTLIRQLPNVADDYLVPYGPFNHIDFIFARDVAKLVYNELLEVTSKY